MALSFGFGADTSKTNGTTTQSGISTTKKVLSQEALDNIVKTVLGGDQGLASLSAGENVSGISGSTVKTQLAQDLVTNIVGNLANQLAETVTTESGTQSTTSSTKKASGGLKTVICTELLRQGLLDPELYAEVEPHTQSLPPVMIRGYQWWGQPIAERMRTDPELTAKWKPIVQARYEHLTGRRKNLIGWATVWIVQPACWILGHFVHNKLITHSTPKEA